MSLFSWPRWSRYNVQLDHELATLGTLKKPLKDQPYHKWYVHDKTKIYGMYYFMSFESAHRHYLSVVDRAVEEVLQFRALEAMCIELGWQEKGIVKLPTVPKSAPHP